MKANNKKTFAGEMKRLDLSWSNLAKLTAKILSHLPNRPLPTHSSGLLDISGPTPIENPEWEFPMLDRSLIQLQSVATFVEGYARTTVFPLEKLGGRATVTALACIDFVQMNRYVPPDILRDLPIEIAAIAQSYSDKFDSGRQQEALGPLAKAVRQHLKSRPDDNAEAVWDALVANPPKGMTFQDNRTGKYVEYDKRTSAGNLKDTGYRRFANIVSEQRKKLNGLTV